MISDEEIDELAAKLREAGSGRKEPEYFREMAREILEAAEPLRDRALRDKYPEPKHSMHEDGEWFYACEACSGLPDGDRQ